MAGTLRRYGPAGSIVLGLLLLAGSALATPVSDTFELDRNTTDDAAPTDDWDNVYKSATGGGTANPSSALRNVFLPDSAEPDPTTFTGGSKDGQPMSDWVCTTAINVNDKADVVNGYAALYSAAGVVRLAVGADRDTNNGTANFGFWLFQDKIVCDPSAGTFSGAKTVGDLYFFVSFAQGGHVNEYNAYTWMPDPNSPGNFCLGDGSLCTDSQGANPLATGHDCVVDPGFNDDLCATVNLDGGTPGAGTISAPWRANIEEKEFVEAGLNLSAIVPDLAQRCYRTYLVNTRESDAFGAALADFVSGELNTCGQIVIRKRTVGGNASFDFQVSQGSLQPASFSLVGGGAQTFLPVSPGSYTIREALPQLPAGWQFGGAQCTVIGPGTSATTHSDGSVDITIALGGTVDCTFTNTATADLTISKSATPSTVAAGGTLTYTITVNNLSATDAQSVQVTDVLPAGTAFVSCTPSQGSCANNAGTVVANLGSIPANGQATISLVVAAPSVASGFCPGTITNTATVTGANESNAANDQATSQTSCVQPASITVDKVTGTPGDPTKFAFTVAGPGGFVDSFGLADADAPHATSPIGPGSYSISEQAVAGWVTGAFCTGGPFGAGGAYGPGTAINVQAGQQIFCTFSNVKLRAAGRTFCAKAAVQDILNPTGTPFKNNTGPDHVVFAHLGESIQAALDAVNDANGDGYVIIGVVAANPAGGTSPYGGNVKQHFEIKRAYPRPFALLGCSVTVHDDDTANGRPTARITAAASNPATSPANPTFTQHPSIFVMDLHGADSELAGWVVDGNGRELRNVSASGNVTGVVLNGNQIQMTNGWIERNASVGVSIIGSGNTVDSTRVTGSGGRGISITGSNNLVYKAAVGDKGVGNGSDGVFVAGNANTVREVTAYANVGNGILATATNHQLLKNTLGDIGKGNGIDGVKVTGSGVLVQENRARANAGDGFDISGGTAAAPNRVGSNQSNTGASASNTENGGAEYRLLNVINNAGGNNKADNIVVPKTTAPPKCSTFPATNATVNFAAAENVCE
jgi:uncharacterized repeat protein (TIGR01451 family)